MNLKQASVKKVLATSENLQILRVRIDESYCDCLDKVVTAYNYLQLNTCVSPGQSVLVNTTGIDLELGTGGFAFVVPNQYYEGKASYGHVIKLRYTPLQLVVDSVEEQESSFHELLQNAQSIEGMPVVCCELHSQMPLIAAALKHQAPKAHVAYIMDDSAALPLAFSKLVQQSLEAELVDTSISSGHAFGGQYEAVNLHSALLSAHLVCKADVAIVAPGPGSVGTGTALGHSSVAQGEALNAVNALGGRAIAALRLSWQDARNRHQGISHHSQTVLRQICLAPVSAPIAANLSPCKLEQIEKKLSLLQTQKGHDVSLVEASYCDIDLRGVEVTTMGRTRFDDPEFFNTTFAAGVLAAEMIA